MSSGIASLHRILRDETRSKVILLLNEKGAMTYTELMEEMGILSTGTLNYHLKVIGDLVTKNETGQYVLTEKGGLAARLLREFPNENSQIERKRRQRFFWTVAAVGQLLILLTVWTLHFAGNLDFARAVQSTIAAISGIALAYVGYWAWSNRPEAGSQKEKARMRIAYPLGGAWLGLVAGFFVPVVLTLISIRLGGPNIVRLIDSSLKLAIAVGGPIVLGAIGGYYLGKRNGFRTPRWVTWLNEKTGFY